MINRGWEMNSAAVVLMCKSLLVSGQAHAATKGSPSKSSETSNSWGERFWQAINAQGICRETIF
ncbi:hypothetical protein BRE01_67590 [Brevibacillus reuszeri]|uniref:SLH domain-containing protein n=1 Tax=Brevibacillus reuszeri TaxID=54915 RepID=A0A0K9YZP4_9BACL|nr:hypothetical protein ADS79_03280 [Brevibacillus reuszeri]GED73057.1 hypothetical protein BRE01_67590 [Brevibacillus reuszeri]